MMKKTIIFTATFFLIVNAKAQQADFGIKGGLNLSSLHDNTASNLAPLPGVNAGFLVHIHASQKWALQPEFMYSSEGGNITLNGGSIYKSRYNLNYLNVPVLLQYMFSNGFRLEGGPQIDFLLSAKRKINNTSTDNKSFKSTALSIPIGVSYLAVSGLGLDARYVFGLSNINSQQNNSSVIQSNVFQVGVFYLLKDNSKRHK